MTNPLILIQTHKPDLLNGRINMVRATWLFQWQGLIDHRFIFPEDYVAEFPDEISFPVPDGILNTSLKVQAAMRWALEHGYTHVFVVPTDCYVVVPLLLASGYHHFSYSGYHTYDERHIGGGSGYWADRHVMEAVIKFRAPPDFEDRWVGNACAVSGIVAHHDKRYTSWEQIESLSPGVITIHLSKNTGDYDPKWMMERHRQYFKGEDIWTRSK